MPAQRLTTITVNCIGIIAFFYVKFHLKFWLGTCYSAAECKARGGVSNGGCAGGFGVCCICKLVFKLE